MTGESVFPDIGALAPIGDGLSAALVGPDGAIEFFCPLRFDAPALVFPLLDRRRGGRLRIGPLSAGDEPLSCGRHYHPASAVLNLEWAGPGQRARLQMAMMWPPPESGQEILWLLEGLEGSVPVEAAMDLRPGFGSDLQGAMELNAMLPALVPEEQVFRVDHFLGKSTVLNMLGLRFTNRLFEPVWKRLLHESGACRTIGCLSFVS